MACVTARAPELHAGDLRIKIVLFRLSPPVESRNSFVQRSALQSGMLS